MNKTLKKVFTTALATTLALSIGLTTAGCGAKIKVDPDKLEYHVGICQLVQHQALDAATAGFRSALTAELAKEGRTVVFDEQNASGDSTVCTTIINNFVANDVDLIMANATPALQAAYNATASIPVLGTSITEYGVALGIKNFTGVVGNNVSGTSDLAPLDTQAQMMLDLVPSANTFGILYCSSEANSKYQSDVVKAYLLDKGKTVNVYTFSDSNDIASVATNAVNACDCIYLPTDNQVASNKAIIGNICSEKNKPAFAGEEGILEGCGFATLSISYDGIGRKTGEMAAQILLGKVDVREMEIGYDANPVKKYSSIRCNALGIVIPTGQGYIDIDAD